MEIKDMNKTAKMTLQDFISSLGELQTVFADSLLNGNAGDQIGDWAKAELALIEYEKFILELHIIQKTGKPSKS